jgi:hypothetical protein
VAVTAQTSQQVIMVFFERNKAATNQILLDMSGNPGAHIGAPLIQLPHIHLQCLAEVGNDSPRVNHVGVIPA